MLEGIKKRIEKEQLNFIRDAERSYNLSGLSPLLSRSIAEFLLRPGKRIRPLLFVIGYSGFTKRKTPGLYRSALAFELLHAFLLVHDDIIDKSPLRRGKPSMHKLLDKYLKNYKDIKFNGQDLAIVAGDVIYALAINAFLAINEDFKRKEQALRKFIEAAVFTGSGEFIELLCATKSLKDLTKKEVYNIYDFKTAYYTFSCPLASGAILAGASQKEVNKLSEYGLCLGRAFQIKDDILGMFGKEKKTGKSSLTDLREAKKTILIWYAYHKATTLGRKTMEKIFLKDQVNRADLSLMREVIRATGSLRFARNEISRLAQKAQSLQNSSKMKIEYKKALSLYTQTLLSI